MVDEVDRHQGQAGENRLDCYRRWHRLANPYFEWQARQFRPFVGRRVADVGCGIGNMTRFFLDRELYVGMDLERELTAEHRREFGQHANVEIVTADILLPSSVALLRSRRVDSILCLNVIEHLTEDAGALSNMVDALLPGGTLCLLVPAMSWLYGTLDALDGHYRRYDKALLLDRLAALPLAIERLYYFNLVGALGWLVKGKILKERRQSEENYRLMNLLVPIVSRLEKIYAPPFGLSLIAIARRV